MPTISKIRIVNFAYNDGNRLFPDELIDLEDSEQNTLDTYLNLINGGGKSVFVQLILQNIIPRATVQGRKIDDFFRRSSDHCFVLLEWHLDTSADKLMTGIAISAGLNAGEDADRTARVKYYTFTCQYDKRGDKNDIINMPLSQTVNNRFKAASYEEIRSLVKSARNISYYPSDDVRRYQNDIEGFGIIHAEWENVIARINNIEGGIEKFFEDYKTSDSLLNNFIIPGIIKRDNERSSGEDGSVEKMFRNYAESYARQNEKIALKHSIEAFISELAAIQPEVKSLWDITDKYDRSIDAMFNFVFSMADIIKKYETEISHINSRNIELESIKRSVEIERISNEYYIAEKQYNEAKAEHDKISEQINNAEEEYQKSEHAVNVLLAAKEYKALTEEKAKYDSLQGQIRAIEDNNYGGYAKQLKYSLYIAAEKLYANITEQLSLTENEKNKLYDEYENLCGNIAALKKEYADIQAEVNKTDGQKTAKTDYIDRALKDIGITFDKNIFGVYPEQDIAAQRTKLDRELADVIVRLEQLENEKAELKNISEQLICEENNNNNRLSELRFSLNDVSRRESEHTDKYNAVKKLTDEYLLSENDIFSDIPKAKLTEYIAAAADELKAVNRRLDTVRSQLEFASKGQLHLHESAVAFLDEVGIDYQTGEKYLLNISENVKSKLLESYPQVAFSIIVGNMSDRNKVLAAVSDNTWICSMVPVFTYEELDDMLNEKYSPPDNFISAYSREYFRDNPDYIARLEDKLKAYTDSADMLNERIKKLNDDITAITAFTYSRNYYDELIAEKSALENESYELDKRNKEIDAQISELSGKINAYDEFIKQAEKEHIRAEYNVNKYNEITAQIAEYADLCAAYDKLCGELNDCGKRLADAEKARDNTAEKLKNCDDMINKYKSESDSINAVLQKVKGCDKTDVLDEDYYVLKAKFDEFSENISKNIAELNDKLKISAKNISEHQSNIKVYQIAEEEYSSAEYSAEKHIAEDEKKRKYYALAEQYKEQGRKIQNALDRAENAMYKCKKQLDEYGAELYDTAHIGTDFAGRIKKCEEEMCGLNSRMSDIQTELGWCRKGHAKALSYIENHSFADRVSPQLIECNAESYDQIKDNIDDMGRKLQKRENEYRNIIHSRLDSFAKNNILFEKTLKGLCAPVDSDDISGDKYYTLNENLEKDIATYKDRIRKLDIELGDVEDSKNQLISNCLQRGRGIYDGLMMLSRKSKVKLSGGEKRMLDIKLPENIDADGDSARLEMGRHIDEYVKKYLECSGGSAERERENIIEKCIEPRTILNCFIGNVSIPVRVYKIDSVQSNSGYRTWEKAKTDNSGGEKFVVFLAIILSMMNYTRGVVDSLKKTSGVLIMDNPFGPISSAHLLKPMFDIAHHFRIQLICLSHIDTADILSCFSNVYQLKIKQLPLSNSELIEAVPMEGIEHAFYRAEQISLF